MKSKLRHVIISDLFNDTFVLTDYSERFCQNLFLNMYANIFHSQTPIERALRKNEDDDMRERIRIMLNASNPFALNACQSDLLKQLNWEARRLVILICINLAKKPLNTKMSKSYDESRLFMSMYNFYDGVWRNIITYL